MAFALSYMGTKRRLSDLVCQLIRDCQAGPLVDVFSGMCSVGLSVACNRQVWSNDLQKFANLVASTLFCSPDGPPDIFLAALSCKENFTKHQEFLSKRHAAKISREEAALLSQSHEVLAELFEDAYLFCNNDVTKCYDLFTTSFACTYFGISQCIEIDSLRYAIDHAEHLSVGQRGWLLLALANAMSRVTTSTGHFAQPLLPKSSNFSKITAQRKRGVWHEYIRLLSSFDCVGTANWRLSNKVFNKDANELITDLSADKRFKGVVYADPPYTKDQYSRYYHLYETLLLYDYPCCKGRGLYRQDRAISDYCLASQVERKFDELIASCAKLRSDLVLSYPTNGLLANSTDRIPSMIKNHYKKFPHIVEVAHEHSTMGASKGTRGADVIEVLYRVCK